MIVIIHVFSRADFIKPLTIRKINSQAIFKRGGYLKSEYKVIVYVCKIVVQLYLLIISVNRHIIKRL